MEYVIWFVLLIPLGGLLLMAFGAAIEKRASRGRH